MRDPSKPRALTIHLPRKSEFAVDTDQMSVPVLGDVAAGIGTLAQENVSDESIYIPKRLGVPGTLFALRVKGDSMIGDGILANDIIVARQQANATTGEIVVAGIFDQSEATVKRVEFDFGRNLISLIPSNPNYSPMVFNTDEVQIYGKVVYLQREY